MSYYILPKNNINIVIEPLTEESDNKQNPFVSHSLHYYLNKLNDQLKIIETADFLLLNKAINSYEFIFTTVPNCNLSVGKLKPFSNLFYVLMEIKSIFKLFDSFSDENINVLIYGKNSKSVIEFLNIMREDREDKNVEENDGVIMKNIKRGFENVDNFRNFTYDFLYYELDDEDYKDETNKYILGMIYILCNIIFNQNVNGISIIKIHNIFYRPLIEILHILSSFYDKVYIIKPIISNVLSSERYIICKNFLLNNEDNYLYNIFLCIFNKVLTKEGENIVSLLKEEVSYYFVNKIEESNIIIGYQQIEYIDQLINLYNNKNKEEKMDILKRKNIQKCIQWCDKLRIPYNKFTDKINIFLNNEKCLEGSINIFLQPKENENSGLVIENDGVNNEDIFIIIEDDGGYDLARSL